MDTNRLKIELSGKPIKLDSDIKLIEGTFEKIEIPTTIKLIAGRINNCNVTYYWKIDNDESFEIGDYAIVENMNDYVLVKIVGVIETEEKYIKYITNCKANKEVKVILSDFDITMN